MPQVKGAVPAPFLDLHEGMMRSCEKKIFKVLLRTMMEPTELPLAELSQELEKAPEHVRHFWMANRNHRTSRLVLFYFMVELMRKREAPDIMVQTFWPLLIEYLEPDWYLRSPQSHRRVRLARAFAEFKRRYDLDTNCH